MWLGLAAMMAIGATGVASARTNPRDYLGVGTWITSQRNQFGTRIFEMYSLLNDGRRLMVRTTIRSSQGTREMTSIYERA